jgi:hypothetical protein
VCKTFPRNHIRTPPSQIKVWRRDLVAIVRASAKCMALTIANRHPPPFDIRSNPQLCVRHFETTRTGARRSESWLEPCRGHPRLAARLSRPRHSVGSRHRAPSHRLNIHTLSSHRGYENGLGPSLHVKFEKVLCKPGGPPESIAESKLHALVYYCAKDVADCFDHVVRTAGLRAEVAHLNM